MLEHLPRELSPRRELARGSERRFFEIRFEPLDRQTANNRVCFRKVPGTLKFL